MKAEFLNPKGYNAPWDHNECEIPIFKRFGLFPKAVFDFRLDEKNPLTFRRANGELVQPDRHFLTDWGSIPVVLRPIIGHDTYPTCYAFHDSAYAHHGLYFGDARITDVRSGKPMFFFREMSMHECNALLREMMEAQGAWGLTANTVFVTLEAVGCFAWNNHHARELKRKAGK